MTKPKKAAQNLSPLKLIHACVQRSQRDPELPDRLVILPLCSICGKPITDFDKAFLFTCLTRANRKWLQVGTIGQDENPLLRDPDALFVGHIACCNRSEANGTLAMFMQKNLSSVLKADQREERDLILERFGM